MFDFLLFDSIYYNFYFLSLILLNVFIYVFLLINIFLIFFLFDVKYIKSLNDLKIFNNVSFLYVSVVLILLSLAGIPPLSGFLGKFLMFIYIFYKNNLIIFLLFIFINIFIIYFYLQNLRFLVSKEPSNNFYINFNKVFFNFKCIKYINVFNFFNVCFILYFEEIIIFLNFLSSNLFF